MQFAITRTLLASAFLASIALAAGATKTQPKQQQQQQQQEQAQQEQKPIAAATKLKRDAGLSFGSGLYHGPSHKYLPPSFASSGGYESTYGTLHGNGLASSSGFDFSSLDTDSGSHQTSSYQNLHHHSPYHHYSQQPHSSYQSLASHHGHGRPVYISSASHGGGYHSQHQHPHHHRAQSPKVETYIVQTSSGGGSSGAGHGHQHQHQGHGIGGSYNKYSAHGGGNSILSLLGGAHKQLHGSTSTYLIASPSYSSGSSHGLGLGHGSSSSQSFGQHYASGLSHALEQQEHFQLPEHSGYSYETPSFKQQPLSSYGVPLLPSGYEHESAADHHHHHHHELEHQEHGLHKLHTEQPQSQPQPPAYALGHKGLGHFSYTSSKPLALNTDVHQLSHTAHEDHNEQQQQQLVAEFTKSPPFKPSAFLGAKHEPSTGYDYATQTSQQYLQAPPTAPQGYDYPAPAVLYGAPGQSGDSATPIFEAPDATYLPPVSSYATPTHSYH